MVFLAAFHLTAIWAFNWLIALAGSGQIVMFGVFIHFIINSRGAMSMFVCMHACSFHFLITPTHSRAFYHASLVQKCLHRLTGWSLMLDQSSMYVHTLPPFIVQPKHIYFLFIFGQIFLSYSPYASKDALHDFVVSVNSALNACGALFTASPLKVYGQSFPFICLGCGINLQLQTCDVCTYIHMYTNERTTVQSELIHCGGNSCARCRPAVIALSQAA